MRCWFMVLVISLGFLINKSATYAQRIRIESYTVDQGLSQSSVDQIVLDSLGFIWIGTSDPIQTTVTG